MTPPAPQPDATAAPSEPPPESWAPTTLSTQLPPEEIVARLLALAKRGKLAGFTAGRTEQPPLFTAEIHGAPFDRLLIAEASRDAGLTRLSLRLHTLRKMPWIFGIVLAFSAGPGLWLTHSMLETYFGWYKLSLLGTTAWYVPLTVLPIPFMLPGMWRKSTAAAQEHAREVTATIAGAIDAT